MKAFYTHKGKATFIRLEINGVALGTISCLTEQLSFIQGRINAEWIEEPANA